MGNDYSKFLRRCKTALEMDPYAHASGPVVACEPVSNILFTVTHSFGAAYCDWKGEKEDVTARIKAALLSAGACRIRVHVVSYDRILVRFDCRKDYERVYQPQTDAQFSAALMQALQKVPA